METPPDLHRKRARSNRALGCAVAACILFVVLVFAVVLSMSSYVGGVNARIAELEEGIRERGQPLTLDELNAYYPAVPDDENAALVYAEAFALMDAIDPGREQEEVLWDRMPKHGSKAAIPPDLLAETRAFVSSRWVILDELEQAVRFSKAHYPLEFWRGAEMEFPHLVKLRSCARLEVLCGTIAAIDEDFSSLLKSQRRALHVADSLQAEPMFKSQVVRAGFTSMAVETLIADLNQLPFPRETLDELAFLYRDRERPECFTRAAAGEWCLCLNTVRTSLEVAASKPSPERQLIDVIIQQSRASYVFRHFGKCRYLRTLELIEPLTAADELPWPERLKRAQIAEEASEDAGSLDFAARYFLPATHGVAITLAREAAVLRMAQTVIAVEQYRTARGALPNSLAQLVPEYLPEVPEDPFDGQPLRYKHAKSGYLVYSVYANEIDDDGVHWQREVEGDGKGSNKGGAQDNGDWVFEVRR